MSWADVMKQAAVTKRAKSPTKPQERRPEAPRRAARAPKKSPKAKVAAPAPQALKTPPSAPAPTPSRIVVSGDKPGPNKAARVWLSFSGRVALELDRRAGRVDFVRTNPAGIVVEHQAEASFEAEFGKPSPHSPQLAATSFAMMGTVYGATREAMLAMRQVSLYPIGWVALAEARSTRGEARETQAARAAATINKRVQVPARKGRAKK